MLKLLSASPLFSFCEVETLFRLMKQGLMGLLHSERAYPLLPKLGETAEAEPGLTLL